MEQIWNYARGSLHTLRKSVSVIAIAALLQASLFDSAWADRKGAAAPNDSAVLDTLEPIASILIRSDGVADFSDDYVVTKLEDFPLDLSRAHATGDHSISFVIAHRASGLGEPGFADGSKSTPPPSEFYEFLDKWNQAPPDKRVFIAYEGEDWEYAQQVADALHKAGYHGFNYRDFGKLAPPDAVAKFLKEAGSGNVLIINSPRARAKLGGPNLEARLHLEARAKAGDAKAARRLDEAKARFWASPEAQARMEQAIRDTKERLEIRIALAEQINNADVAGERNLSPAIEWARKRLNAPTRDPFEMLHNLEVALTGLQIATNHTAVPGHRIYSAKSEGEGHFAGAGPVTRDAEEAGELAKIFGGGRKFVAAAIGGGIAFVAWLVIGKPNPAAHSLDDNTLEPQPVAPKSAAKP